MVFRLFRFLFRFVPDSLREDLSQSRCYDQGHYRRNRRWYVPAQNCTAHPNLTRWDVSMATGATGLHPQETGEDAPARTARLVIETRAGSHPHAPGSVLRTSVQSPRTRISTWTGMPHSTTRDTDPMDRHSLVLGGRHIALFRSCILVLL